MVRKCQGKNCTTYAHFNISTETVGLFCSKCKTDEMTNVVDKTCIGINKKTNKPCTKRPAYNIKGQRPEYCKECSTSEMTDVINKRCLGINEETGKQCNMIPLYNFKGLKAEYCKEHSDPNMSDVKHKTCIGINKDTEEKCDKRPNYNIKGTNIGLYCRLCALPGMADVTHRVCITELCTTRVHDDKYKGYCFNCYTNIYPDEPSKSGVVNNRTKEICVSNYITKEFSDYQLQMNKTIINGTSGRRPDILLELEDRIIIIEVDEHQHKRYEDDEDDEKRLHEISNDIKDKILIFIRFNPDGYKNINKKETSCWGNRKDENNVKKFGIVKQAEWDKRLLQLKKTINKYITKELDKDNIYVSKLYFDKN